MKKVPNIISTKDLSYLTDIFNWNYNVCKKTLYYSSIIEDSEIKKEIHNTFKMHNDICNDILNILKKGGK